MVGVPADPAAKRLLCGTVLAGDVVTALALLRTVGTLDLAGTHAPFGRAPHQLLWDVSQVGSVEIGIHTSGLEPHPRDMQVLISKLGIWIIGIELVHGTINLLPDMARQLLVAGGRQALEAFLLEAGPQLGLAATLGAVPFVARGKLAMERPILLPTRAAYEIVAPHVNSKPTPRIVCRTL